MSLQWTTSAQLTMPSAGAAINANGSNSGWVTLSSGGPAVASLLTGVLIGGQAATFNPFAFDIGVGGAGSEVAIYSAGLNFQNQSSLSNYLPVTLPTASMPAGVRVAFRITGGSATAYKCAITYMPAAFTGSLQTTTSPILNTTFTPVVTTSATPYANSAWVQMIASTSTAIVLHGISILANNFVLANFEVDIGTGGVGAEAVVTSHAGYVGFSTHVPWIMPWQNPFDGVASGVRVAVRVRSSASSAISVPIALHYWAKPL